MAVSDAQRQKDKRDRSAALLLCTQGAAFILVDGARVSVTRFLAEPLDADGFPTLGQYGYDPGPTTFAVAEAEFVGARAGLAAHGPRGPHNRCRVCWDDEIRAQRKRRRQRAKGKGKGTKGRRSSRRQGVFAWAA